MLSKDDMTKHKLWVSLVTLVSNEERLGTFKEQVELLSNSYEEIESLICQSKLELLE